MSLPLRLAAEPILRGILTACNVLPSADEERVCLVVCEEGFVAIVSADLYSAEETSSFIGITVDDIPAFALVRKSSDSFAFYLRGQVCDPAPSRAEILELAKPISVSIARIVVDSIKRYYSRQVLEPSIRGFLAILEKQFPRNDLYLFELLQNAVDDGADHVVLRIVSSVGGREGVHFHHNGRRFSPIDVVGLSSVGLSTKDLSGERKKIGFMGVGFKSVYKRFAKVTIFDSVWCFRFEQPVSSPPMEPSYSWVLKPGWVGDLKRDYSSSSQLAETTRGPITGCHFFLEDPQKGGAELRLDLSHFAVAVPVLLGRQTRPLHPGGPAIDAVPSAGEAAVCTPWVLEWDTKIFTVSRELPAVDCTRLLNAGDWGPRRGTVNAAGVVFVYSDAMQCRIRSAQRPHNQKAISSAPRASSDETQRWQFLTVCISPSGEAKDAFLQHTKRPWSGRSYAPPPPERGEASEAEEISLFFPVDLNLQPLLSAAPSSPGVLHAVLPTKLKLPFAMNLQASWLLSVDRQEVQSLSENHWNHCLISQLPRLLTLLIKWIAASYSPEHSNLKASYSLLPAVDSADESGAHLLYSSSSRLHLTVLGQRLDLSALNRDILSSAVVPVCGPSNAVSFHPGAAVMFFPPAMTAWIPASVLKAWFDRLPFASSALGSCSWHPLWLKALARPTMEAVASRKRHFKSAIVHNAERGDVVYLSLRIMAALWGCLSVVPPSHSHSAATTAAGDESLSSRSAHSKPPGDKRASAVVSRPPPEPAEASEMLCGGYIAGLTAWPIFYTTAGEFVSSGDLAYPSPDDFGTLPADLLAILRPAAAFALESDLQRKQSLASSGQSSELSSSRNAYLIHDSLQEAVDKPSSYTPAAAASSAGPDTLRRALDGARACLDLCSRLHPDRVVSVAAASHALMRRWAADCNNRIGQGLSDTVVASIKRIFDFALSADRPELVTHFLTTRAVTGMRDSALVVTPAFKCHIPTAFESNAITPPALESILGSSLHYISSAYYTPELLANEKQARRLESFLVRCGVQRGAGLVGTMRSLTEKEISAYLPGGALPTLRQSAPSIPLYLPFGFGEVNRKKLVVIDADFSVAWLNILNAARSSVDIGTYVSRHMSHLLEAADCADPVTPTAAPYLSSLVIPTGAINAKQRQASPSLVTLEMLDEHRIPQNTDEYPPPAYARLFYLPPGQPGEWRDYDSWYKE